ncbi:CoA pyrophosphatase [Bacillus sp. 165]|uniref:NUDIX hydrolase n=1 Tax=Bacillus sp. 165 TaxID=1529117 RepID=UPI001ADB6D44|nr:CoA pyrophosphatase [Bacillus sp. 165]MBO9129238.1 CoA pyrophosphatase [Bacillus sp. 165]
MNIENITKKFHNRVPAVLGSEKFSTYAVLLPIVKVGEDLHILFEVRAHHLRRQPGEICFPGGRIDAKDTGPKHAAIRETTEELNINTNEISNVLPLDYMVSPFGTIIYPFVGIITTSEPFTPNPSEVAEVFTVPLSTLQQAKPDVYTIRFNMEPEQNFPFHLIAGGENYNWQARGMEEYFYYYEGRVIWGLTARILHHFLSVLDQG